MSGEQKLDAGAAPTPDAVLEWIVADAAEGTVCALLTPAIKSKLREMAPGQVLEVRVNDATARDDIAAWCRLSGHELVTTVEEPPQLLHAYLRKKQG
jgi:tRNA 2-thiouridine synthesizing protein A